MATHLGKRDATRMMKLRDVIGEHMTETLLESEILFYYLLDSCNMNLEQAKELAVYIHKGGKKMNANAISDITESVGVYYELSTRQINAFMKEYMKSTRIQIVDDMPKTWQMNGFSRYEEPYIAGYCRETFASLVEEKEGLQNKINKLNVKIQEFPNNINELFTERQRLIKTKNAITQKIQERLQ